LDLTNSTIFGFLDIKMAGQIFPTKIPNIRVVCRKTSVGLVTNVYGIIMYPSTIKQIINTAIVTPRIAEKKALPLDENSITSPIHKIIELTKMTILEIPSSFFFNL
jgi:hypothetical protein